MDGSVEWEALVRREGCPLCAELTAAAAANEHGSTVADLTISWLRLAANQWVSGYCVLICAVHVREPHELRRADRLAFFEDLALVGAAIESVYRPDKLNVQLLGNAVPHLHAHSVSRYYGDPAPHRPLDPNLGHRVLAADDAAGQIAALRTALATRSLGNDE
jgi:diadenosine tetraphosphate (Ap4A) HIT family hydrolase